MSCEYNASFAMRCMAEAYMMGLKRAGVDVTKLEIHVSKEPVGYTGQGPNQWYQVQERDSHPMFGSYNEEAELEYFRGTDRLGGIDGE